MANENERARRIIDEVTKRTACEHYRMVLNEERTPAADGSKIGGKPYWPAGKEYPLDAKGNKMLMVLQINCEEAGFKAPLPERGMLQWFISLNPEWMYGCQGNYDETGDGFRIIYHEEIDGTATAEDVPCHSQVEDMFTPVKRETAIDFETEQTVMGVSDGHFNDLFTLIVKELSGEDLDGKMWYEYLSNDECLLLEKELGMSQPRHQMFGYPVYTQGEARRDMSKHDTLLIQLDSQFSTLDRKELVMWGDMGSGFIFINRDDLAARDFSHCYYCWDCG